MRFSLFSTLVFLVAVFSVFGQEATPTPPEKDDEVLKISTALIQIDITVTDKKGNVVNNLRPEEFEIYENGKKQPLTSFSFVSADKTSVNPNQTNSLQKDKNTIPIPPAKLKPEQVRRTYALVVDDLGVGFENIYWVKQALKKFINEQMQDGDLVAIIRTGSGVGALQSFTSDKRQLTAAVETIKWNAYGRKGIESFAPLTSALKEDLSGLSNRNIAGIDNEKAAQAMVDQFRSDNFSVGTLGALSYVISGMRDLPGRKSIILFSEGFVGGNGRFFDTIRIIADLANRSSVVIYTIDPRGLENPDMYGAQDNVKNVFPGSAGATERSDRTTGYLESQMSLSYLAKETGGFAFLNRNSLDKGLRTVVNDQSGYYLLGYEPNDDTFDPKKAKFNKFEVKVTRPDLMVRYRSGFYGISDEKIRNLTQTPQQKLVSALVSPFKSDDISLNLYPVFQNDPATGDMIQALVHINARNLQFIETNGNHKANFDLIAMTFGDNGVQVDRFLKNYSIEVSEKLFQNMMQNGFVYTLPVPIKKTGAYQFRVALHDTVSGKVGSASQFIEVPDIKKRLTLSNLVLDGFSSEEWQKVLGGGSRDVSEKSVLLDATLRQFKRGTIVRYDYVIYNPKQNRSLEARLRLVKDGKVIYEEKAAPINYNGQADLLRLQTAGALSLGNDLETGTHILQIIVSDRLSTRTVATQFVEFEIVE